MCKQSYIMLTHGTDAYFSQETEMTPLIFYATNATWNSMESQARMFLLLGHSLWMGL
jgi:hypothetical protein